ncbi:NAD-dependent epimerase/dehydratase family protein, partial [Acinetobacter baumannii]
AGSIQLVKSMEKAGVYRLVFSSSATVYGGFNPSPYQEDMPLTMPNNNYGYTK